MKVPLRTCAIFKHLVYNYIHGYFMNSMSGTPLNGGEAVSQQERIAEPKEPEEYRVFLLNDVFTTIEFVVSVLMTIFHKSLPDATKIMIDVHRKGRGIVGEYSYDIAATKSIRCTRWRDRWDFRCAAPWRNIRYEGKPRSPGHFQRGL